MDHDTDKSSRVRRVMESAGLDVILARHAENVLYFTNTWPITGWGLVAVFKDRETTVFLPESELDFARRATTKDVRVLPETSHLGLAKAIESLEIEAGSKVGLELSKEGLASSHLGYEIAFPGGPTFAAMQETLAGCNFMDATGFIEEMRACKTSLEIDQYRLVNEINAIGLGVAESMVGDPGKTEMEIATSCEKAIMDSIADYVSVDFIRSYAFVMAGENGFNAGRPFNISSGKKCKTGEFVMLELNTQVNGYWSDLTRTWVCGRKPTPEQRDQQDAVNGAIKAAYAAMVPGGSWLEAYQLSRDYIVERGYGDAHGPFLGHGIGVKLHEPIPMMHPGVDPAATFETGHYCSVEPGLYFKKTGALRYERDVAITKNGPDELDTYPCEL